MRPFIIRGPELGIRVKEATRSMSRQPARRDEALNRDCNVIIRNYSYPCFAITAASLLVDAEYVTVPFRVPIPFGNTALC